MMQTEIWHGWLWSVALLASAGAHVALLFGLPARAPVLPAPAPSVVKVSVAASLPRQAPPPPAPSTPPPRAAPAPRRIATPAPARPQPLDDGSHEPPASEPAVDLTGVTLTNQGSGSGWAAPVGNGAGRREPIRRPTPARAPQPQREHAPAPIRRSAPQLVPVRDLSRPPTPPALGPLLRRQYPSAARRQGLEGDAVVRGRVDPDGLLRSTHLVSETAPGFGAACQRTLAGSRWSIPLDRHGHPVATLIVYTCRFRVDR